MMGFILGASLMLNVFLVLGFIQLAKEYNKAVAQ